MNANRTYYLTRSQPPFLTQMLLACYRRQPDRDWLAGSVDAIEKYYQYWTTEPHLTPETGLSRYFDTGEGPAPEVVSSEIDSEGRTDYDLIKRYFRPFPNNFPNTVHANNPNPTVVPVIGVGIAANTPSNDANAIARPEPSPLRCF